MFAGTSRQVGCPVSFEKMRLFLGLLTAAANITVIAAMVLLIAGRVSMRWRAARDAAFASVEGWEPWFAGGVATVCTLGSLYLSEIVHLVPCQFCWFQRIVMYPLAVILLIAAWRKDERVRLYVVVLAATGAAISTWHYTVQNFPNLGGGACSSGVPCNAPDIGVFGFMHIPYMALSGFLLILTLMLVQRLNSNRHEEPAHTEQEIR